MRKGPLSQNRDRPKVFVESVTNTANWAIRIGANRVVNSGQ
jgi:hypothetical protein